MAKQRYVNTRFWSDTYISNLDPIEKLLFLYFLTNERTNVCGIYELPLKIMAVETGIEKDMIEKIIRRFTKEKKVFYYQGWVRVVNFPKHQDTSNPHIKKGIELAESLIPAQIKEKLYAIDSLYIAYGRTPNNSNSNSNLNSNSNSIATDVAEKTGFIINSLIKDFEPINPSYEKFFSNKTQRAALERLLKKHSENNVRGFIKYLPFINEDKYAKGKSITPLEMENNLAHIYNHYKQKKNNKPKIALIPNE